MLRSPVISGVFVAKQDIYQLTFFPIWTKTGWIFNRNIKIILSNKNEKKIQNEIGKVVGPEERTCSAYNMGIPASWTEVSRVSPFPALGSSGSGLTNNLQHHIKSSAFIFNFSIG